MSHLLLTYCQQFLSRSESLISSPVTQKTISRDAAKPLSNNVHLLNWVEKMAALTKPAAIHWVDGSLEEDEQLKSEMVTAGTFIKLNEELGAGAHVDLCDAALCRAVDLLEGATRVHRVVRPGRERVHRPVEPRGQRKHLAGAQLVG